MAIADFIVTDAEAGQRLDIVAAQKLSVSRSQVQKGIKEGSIVVNGRSANPHYALKAHDAIAVVPVAKDDNNAAMSAVLEPLPDVVIIAETDDYVVINKPAGLLMHPAHDIGEPSLVDWLVGRYPAVAKVGEDPLRPGIVHRLDREVSGLVVIAKNQAMFDCLKGQFQARTIAKYYHALVHGGDMPDEGEINFRIERSTQGYKMAAKPLSQTGKTAITLFETEKRYHNYAFLKLRIKTGRTHQIRAHLSAYGHPVVGDDLYATPRFKALNKKLKLGRIFLVATDLSFVDLAGELQSFTLGLPVELQSVLGHLS